MILKERKKKKKWGGGEGRGGGKLLYIPIDINNNVINSK